MSLLADNSSGPPSTVSEFNREAQSMLYRGFLVAMLFMPSGILSAEIDWVVNEELLTLAKSGDSEAQHKLCFSHIRGQGAVQDYTKAFMWCSQAASHKNNTSSQVLLAELYYHGNGVARDLEKSFELNKRAADQGHRHAQYMTGYQLFYGKGIERDKEKAREYLRMASDNGHESATQLLQQKSLKEKLMELFMQ